MCNSNPREIWEGRTTAELSAAGLWRVKLIYIRICLRWFTSLLKNSLRGDGREIPRPAAAPLLAKARVYLKMRGFGMTPQVVADFIVRGANPFCRLRSLRGRLRSSSLSGFGTASAPI